MASFLRRPACERALLLRAAVVLALVRAGLAVLPFSAALRLVRRFQGRAGVARVGALQPREMARAVHTAGRVVPGATCLVQALAGRILLSRAGHATELRIGVARHDEAGFEAHAWLEHRGEILLGELADMARLTPLPSLEQYLG